MCKKRSDEKQEGGRGAVSTLQSPCQFKEKLQELFPGNPLEKNHDAFQQLSFLELFA